MNIAFQVATTTREFFLYSSGIYTGAACITPTRNMDLNHAMLAVGFGVDVSGTGYAIIKNSWGTSWGMSGYSYIALTDDTSGTCGLYLMNYQTYVGF